MTLAPSETTWLPKSKGNEGSGGGTGKGNKETNKGSQTGTGTRMTRAPRRERPTDPVTQKIAVKVMSQ